MDLGPFVVTHAPLRLIPARIRTILREDRALRSAIRTMPRPVPWDWAAPRLMPLLAGSHLDRVGGGLVRTIAEFGCALEYGLDLGGTFSIVDQAVAERWERSANDLHATAMENLRRRAGGVLPMAVVGGTIGGRYFRRVLAPRGCASSLILAPDQLVRLLGPDPSILAAPSRNVLLAFPLLTDGPALARIAIEFEAAHPYPLQLDPFVLEDGRIVWADESGDQDDWAWSPA